MSHFNDQQIKAGIIQILEGLGIDWQTDHNFTETPDRVTRAYYELNRGLFEPIDGIKTFPSTYQGMVLVKAIKTIGLCPHHLLPIDYSISFAYIPSDKVVGLSKIPRIIKRLSARPVLQEDLTKDIVTEFKKQLNPTGIAVVIRGIHGCMKYRGIVESDQVTTSELTGVFMTNEATRAEFYSLIKEEQ